MTEQPDPKGRPRQVRIEINDDVADGVYSNLAFITANKSEIILDFARFLPGNTRGRIVSRMVMSPTNAKGLLVSLTEAVEKFEKQFGKIEADRDDKNIGFQINRAEHKTGDGGS